MEGLVTDLSRTLASFPSPWYARAALATALSLAAVGALDRGGPREWKSSATPPWRWPLLAVALVGLITPLLLAQRIEDEILVTQLAWCATLSVLVGYGLTLFMVPIMCEKLPQKMCGHDQCKSGAEKRRSVPESLGLIPGINFLICVIVSSAFLAFRDETSRRADYDAALLSVCFMLLLGFVDDILDIPWRYKMTLPLIASLPLLVGYDGSTSILIPRPFRAILATPSSSPTSGLSALTGRTPVELTMVGSVLDAVPFVTVDRYGGGGVVELGVFFYVFMAVLALVWFLCCLLPSFLPSLF